DLSIYLRKRAGFKSQAGDGKGFTISPDLWLYQRHALKAFRASVGIWSPAKNSAVCLSSFLSRS
ncbi:MAG: hypothetical protein V3R25_09335, partial [Nitrosomonadaceae bacterium]